MEIKEYFQQKIKLYDLFQGYINSEKDSAEYNNLIQYIQNQKIDKNVNEFYQLLRLISSIAQNHHRDANLFILIEQLIIRFQEDIKQTFSNLQLFKIFKKCKLLILFLIDNQIMTFDESVYEEMKDEDENMKTALFCHFFYPEIKRFIKEEEELKRIENELLKYDSQIFDYFNNQRHQGENEALICSIIRKDLIDEFITYINQKNISLSSQIKPSLFETNSYLEDKTPTLIEYAAFFGSIQIFEYLRKNNAQLGKSSQLMFYAIHGNNSEIIQFVEDNLSEMLNSMFYLKEAMKCHHRDVCMYIQNNEENEAMNDFFEEFQLDNSTFRYNQNPVAFALHYCNYEFLQDDFDINELFLYACKYNYLNLVNILLRTGNVNLAYKEYEGIF